MRDNAIFAGERRQGVRVQQDDYDLYMNMKMDEVNVRCCAKTK